jgi:hypothetical protein
VTAAEHTSGFDNGYPSEEASRQLYDELDYQRAVQAYIWATPLVNSIAVEKAFLSAGAKPEAPSLWYSTSPCRRNRYS